ncbi:MAG TPA: acylneuraminate cytidylyltransferase family protein [Paracoccaceae bacterium]|nr:acylneuraminate cytidylyltransferase family protein [Paracoccaceae bacterium]
MNRRDAYKRRIALIPARSGSRGVRHKNLREIGGQSLLARAIGVARETGLFDRVFVSTDSPDYAAEAARAGIDTPWLRPDALASDTALVADTIRHTIETFAAQGEAFDTLALMEPTSPLRGPEVVARVVAAAEAEGWDAGFTVSPVPVHFHALKQFRLDAEGAAGFVVARASPNVNRQSLDPTYVRNGLAYAVRVEAFLRTNSIHGTRARAIDPGTPAISIDTEQDLSDARALIEARENGGA